ncbi:MAG: DUF4159 domain-containing protein [Candidatus Kapaibacteriales bacterium]
MRFLISLLLFSFCFSAQADGIKLARVKYTGGGDWYNDPSAEVNLLKFVSSNTNIQVDAEYQPVELSSNELFNFPLIFLTGHGSIDLNSTEREKLKSYLENGGFLYVDDDYGMDKYVRPLLEDILPDAKLERLPLSHPIFSSHFNMRSIPKTHEHDEAEPEVYGLYYQNRIVAIYTFESNPSDGWADPAIHGDTPEKREEALRFGANIIVFALTN